MSDAGIEPRVLNTGEGRVLVGFTAHDLLVILNYVIDQDVRDRCILALGIIDPEAAKEFEPEITVRCQACSAQIIGHHDCRGRS